MQPFFCKSGVSHQGSLELVSNSVCRLGVNRWPLGCGYGDSSCGPCPHVHNPGGDGGPGSAHSRNVRYALPVSHSSLISITTAVTRRRQDAALGNSRATRVRRLIS